MAQTWKIERLADGGEKLLFAALFAYFAFEFSSSFLANPNVITGLYLADQTIVMLFLLFRRPAQMISTRLADYPVAAAGTLLPLLAVPPSGPMVAPMPLLAVLAFLGILLHLGAKLSLRRSFGIVAADRGVKVEGPYRLVRHPMYLGYIMVQLALLLAGPSVWNAVIFALTWVMLVLRISAEEKLLAHNAAYRAFQAKTRFRLIPGLY